MRRAPAGLLLVSFVASSLLLSCTSEARTSSDRSLPANASPTSSGTGAGPAGRTPTASPATASPASSGPKNADPHPPVPAQGPRPAGKPDRGPRPAADFNGDGYADLAARKEVSVPGDTDRGRGLVQVLYGSPTGLRPVASQQWSRADFGARIEGDAFGRALANGDLDGDGYSDLVIGDPGATDEGWGSGDVRVLYGSSAGLAATRTQRWSLGSPGLPGRADVGDGFGEALAVGNFGQGGQDDLAIGAPGRKAAGAAVVLFGGDEGLAATHAQVWSQDSSGIPGRSATHDDFGRSLAAGDFDGGGYDELVVGAPYDTVAGLEGAGSLYVLHGGDDGLTARGVQHWMAGRGGLLGETTGTGGFGAVFAVGSFTESGHLDLAVGRPAWDSIDTGGAGAVHVLYGSARGLSARGNQLWTQYELGTRQVAGDDVPEDSPQFGASLAVADFGRGPADDLVVGVPEANTAGFSAGAVHIIYGTPTGLRSVHSREISQVTPGIKGYDSDEARFGAAVAVWGPTGPEDYPTLVVGVPWYGGRDDEDRSGIIQLIPGSAGGLTAGGDQIWNASVFPPRPVGESFGETLTG